MGFSHSSSRRGELSPAFAQANLAYAATASISTFGLPITITPTVAAESTVTINGTGIASGTASPSVVRAETTPVSFDVKVTSAAGVIATYRVTLPPLLEGKGTQLPLSSNNSSIGLSGDTVAVGSCKEAAINIYVRKSTTWFLQSSIPDPENSKTFGCATFEASGYGLFGVNNRVVLSGDTPAVASPATVTGYIYVRSGTSWILQAKIAGVRTLCISGDTLVYNNLHTSTPVSINERSGTTWKPALVGKRGAVGRYGFAIPENTLAVGA